MIGLKENLGPGKLHMLYTCCALSAPVILLFAYWPLISKLDNSASRLDEVQAELLNHRSAVAVLDNSNVEGELIRQDDISLAIAELTEKGRSLGLKFSSIAQLPLQETAQAGIAMLPISFTIGSEYKTAGQFLAHIEDSPCGITKVESLSIRPKEVDQSELSVELMLNLYVEIENET